MASGNSFKNGLPRDRRVRDNSAASRPIEKANEIQRRLRLSNVYAKSAVNKGADI
jgi:hypothetical protein